MVPAGIDGLSIRPIETMGGSEVNDLYFTDCFLPWGASSKWTRVAWFDLVPWFAGMS